MLVTRIHMTYTNNATISNFPVGQGFAPLSRIPDLISTHFAEKKKVLQFYS